MSSTSNQPLRSVYLAYIDALRAYDVEALSNFVDEKVIYNGQPLGLGAFKDLIRDNIAANEMSIAIQRLIADESHVACCVIFTCPSGPKKLLGIETDGAEFSFMENVMYDFQDGKIVEIFSVVDVGAIKSRKSTLPG